MLVHRMEHRTKLCGPFVTTFLLDGNESKHIADFTISWTNNHSLNNHPNPYEDGLLGVFKTEVHILGVESLECILSWFGSELEHLKAANYVVNVYDVDDDNCAIGHTQVAFCRENIINLVETIEL